MTRNEKIALAIGGGVLTVGAVAIYFMATSKPPAAPQQTPQIPPTPPAPTESFAPTLSPSPQPAPHITPASQFPPSWNQFTSVIAGHRYLVQLHSTMPFDWSHVNPSAIPGSFSNFRPGNPSANYYSYTLDAHVSHQVQNVMFLLGLTAYIEVNVFDLGATP